MLMALHTLALYGNGGGGFRALLDKPGFIIGSAFFFLSLLDLDKPQSDQGHIPLSPLAL